MAELKVGDTIYHESRYWVQDIFGGGEEVGWNAKYLPYTITRITDKTIFAEGRETDGTLVRVQLQRQCREKKPGHVQPSSLETNGKQYHSRFREYFYAEIPKKQSRRIRLTPNVPQAFSTLGLNYPCTRDELTRAYKRLARKHHPDAGGTHEKFLALKAAYDSALMYV